MKRKHIVDIVFALLLVLTFCDFVKEIYVLIEKTEPDLAKHLIAFLPLCFLLLVVGEIELWCDLRYFALERAERSAIKTVFHLVFLFTFFLGVFLFSETWYVSNILTRWLGFPAVKRLFLGVALLWFLAKVIYLFYLCFGGTGQTPIDDDSSVSSVGVMDDPEGDTETVSK